MRTRCADPESGEWKPDKEVQVWVEDTSVDQGAMRECFRCRIRQKQGTGGFFTRNYYAKRFLPATGIPEDAVSLSLRGRVCCARVLCVAKVRLERQLRLPSWHIPGNFTRERHAAAGRGPPHGRPCNYRPHLPHNRSLPHNALPRPRKCLITLGHENASFDKQKQKKRG